MAGSFQVVSRPLCVADVAWRLLACRGLCKCTRRRSPLSVFLLWLWLLPAPALTADAYPEFDAVYDARVGGITVARAGFSLRRLENGEYLYQRSMQSTGLAALFGGRQSLASSRWNFVDGRIQALEFRSRSLWRFQLDQCRTGCRYGGIERRRILWECPDIRSERRLQFERPRSGDHA